MNLILGQCNIYVTKYISHFHIKKILSILFDKNYKYIIQNYDVWSKEIKEEGQTASAECSSCSIFVRSFSAFSKASISPFADSEFVYYRRGKKKKKEEKKKEKEEHVKHKVFIVESNLKKYNTDN